MADVNVEVVFVSSPTSVEGAVTSKLIEHDALAAREPPIRLTEVAPALAVNVPPQPLEAPLGVDTTSPPGSVSEKTRFVKVAEFGLPMVNVTLVDPFGNRATTPKALVIVGGMSGITTVSVAVAGFGLFPAPRARNAYPLVCAS